MLKLSLVLTRRTWACATLLVLVAAGAFGQQTTDPGDNPIQVLSHPGGAATQFLQTNAAWKPLTHQQGALLFTDTKSKRSGILGNVTHQDPKSGAWVENDPTLSLTTNGWRLDGTANSVVIRASGATQHVVTETYTDYTTKHNSVLGVTLPTLTYGSGFTFHFAQDGLAWDLRFRQSGFFEFGTTVAKKMGAAAHSFAVTSSETLTVNAAGQLVGDSNVGLNRAVMLPRFGKAVPCSAWSYASKTGVASFTCDDSAFKANQLPYRIDPDSGTLTDTQDTVYADAYDDGQGDSSNDPGTGSHFSCAPQICGMISGGTITSASCSFTTDWASLTPGNSLVCAPGAYYGTQSGAVPPSTAEILIIANADAPYSDSAAVSDIAMTVYWTMPQPPSISVSPANGSAANNTSQTFTVTVVPGAAPYNGANTVIPYIGGATLNFGGTALTGTCSIYVAPVWNGGGFGTFYANTYLNSDSGSYVAGLTQNSQCSISMGTVTASGGSISFPVAVTFTPAFNGSRGAWGTAADTFGDTEAWTQLGTWTVTSPPAAVPTISPGAGTYTTGQSVTLSDSTPGATMVYTTDGSTPTHTHGTVYTGAIAVNSTATVNAFAYETGWLDSSVASSAFTITGTVAAPAMSPAGGTYTSPVTVTLSTTPSAATIHYTLDGSTPIGTEGSVRIYSGPFAVSVNATVKAYAFEATLGGQRYLHCIIYNYRDGGHADGISRRRPI